jgi:uncharacterized membrane protein
MDTNRDFPPELNYNPSSWSKRTPLIIASSIGFCIALYLAFYQMHVLKNVWEPFFGNGTKEVLTSTLSQKFPIPDALLGAFGYLFDIIFGSIGSTNRWRTKPWIVLLFGIVVALLGLTSIFLVLAQLLFLKSACTLCLCSAIISISLINPAMHEVLASVHYLKKAKIKHLSVWQALWGNKEIQNRITF